MAGRRYLETLLRSDLTQKIAETYLTQVMRIGFGLATTVVVSRLLGPEGRGLYAVAMAIGALGVQFGTFGLHTSNTYFVAKDQSALPTLLGNTLVVSLVLGISGGLGAWIVFLRWPSLVPVGGGLLVLALVWIPIGLVYTLSQNLLLGVHDVRGYNKIEFVKQALTLALVILVAAAGLTRVTSMFSAGLAALTVCSCWIVSKLNARHNTPPVPSWEVLRENFGYGTRAYLASVFCFLVLRADLLMVGYMLGAEQAGYYSIAATMADYVALLPTVAGTILFPRLSAMSNLPEKLRLTRKAVLGVGAVLVPLLLVSGVLARPLVQLLFGPAFLPAVNAFLWLIPGMLLLGLHAVLVQFLNSIGYPIGIVFAWGFCAFLNIGLNLWAIPAYGIAGASVVSSVSYMVALLWIVFITAQKAGFRVKRAVA